MEALTQKISTYLAENKTNLPDTVQTEFRRIAKILQDPEIRDMAMISSRKIMEFYLKEAYALHKNIDPDRLGFIKPETILQELSRSMPMDRQGALRMVQSISNYWAHAQNTAEDVDAHTLEGVICFLFSLIDYVEQQKQLSTTQKVVDSYPITAHNHQPLVLAIDVGTSKIAAALVSLSDRQQPRLLEQVRVFHNEIDTHEGILGKIESVSNHLLSRCQVSFDELSGVGIGLPGQVDYRTGLLKMAPGLKLRNIHVASRLQASFGKPVYVDNDVNCATLAELQWGQGKTFSNFACIFVGTGIGAGLVFNGQLYRGATYAAGEIGHTKVSLSSTARPCTCGAKGCFEEYASARAIVRMAREAIFDARERKIKSVLTEISPEIIRPEDIVNAVQNHDPLGIELAEKIAAYLASGVSNLANLLNTEAIILGGGIIQGFYQFDFFSDLFTRVFKELTLDACAATSILTSTFEESNPLYGAAALVQIK